MTYEQYLKVEFEDKIKTGKYELKSLPFHFMKCSDCPYMEECFSNPATSNCITITEKHLKDKVIVEGAF